jgi:predicted transcriptional regulator
MLDLAEASGVRMVVIMRLEDGRKPPPAAKVAKLRRAFEEAGVQFEAGGSVRLHEPSTGVSAS